MEWRATPIIKFYEAIGAIVDGRIELIGNPNQCKGEVAAKVKSSEMNKEYLVKWNAVTREIMTNDNGSYWQGYLGYPGIAFLLKTGLLHFDASKAQALKGFEWKKINQKNQNDFEKTLSEVKVLFAADDWIGLQNSVDELVAELRKLKVGKLGKRMVPAKSMMKN